MSRDRGSWRDGRPAQGGAAALIVVALVASLAMAGCLGSGPDGAPTETGTAGEDDGDASDGTGSGDGSDDADEDGNRSSDPEARTPSDAMPNQTAAETGDGYAKFEVEGQASPAVDTQVAFSHLVDADAYDVKLQDDVTLVEVLVTWESDHADLDCQISWDDGSAYQCTNHGMRTQQEIEDAVGVAIFQDVNASQWEHLALSPSELDVDPDDFPLDGTLEIREDEVWEPTSAPAEVDESLGGLPYTVQVWVHTVPAEPSHKPTS